MPITDLTLTMHANMRGVNIQPKTHLAQEGYNTTNLHLYSHAGTHLDAPRHFLDAGRTLEQLELHKCIGSARVVNLAHKAPRSLITVEDMRPFAEHIGQGARLLLRTDWDRHADLPDYRTDFPRISLPLAHWLVEKEIGLLGVETPSVASLQDRAELTAVHQTLLRGEIVIVESLANLRQLPDEVFFVALPLKIEHGDGSPVRAIAIDTLEQK